jgi:aminomethyltransferase
MRISPLHDVLAAKGATFEERFGVEITGCVSDFTTEYALIRNTIGLSDFSFMQKFTVPEEAGIDFLDNLFAGNVAKVRFGRVLHTFLADDDGYIIADCYIANNDEEFVLLCESIVDDAALWDIFEKHGASEAGLKDCTEDHVVLSIDGYKSWAVVKDIFGVDVLGLPYLSIEMYPFNDTDIRFFRSGKTSEFGYLVMAPRELAEELFSTVLETVKKYEGGLCGLSVHNDLRLEGRFFNIFSEGALVKDPLALGLQWMIDFDKDSYAGSDEITKRREEGLTRKIIGIQTDADLKETANGIVLFDEEDEVADIKAACFSPTLNCSVGLALFPAEIAYAGLTFKLGSPDGPDVLTISMPPIMPKSLSVKLDEM